MSMTVIGGLVGYIHRLKSNEDYRRVQDLEQRSENRQVVPLNPGPGENAPALAASSSALMSEVPLN